MGEEQLFPLSYHVFVLNVVCDFLENLTILEMGIVRLYLIIRLIISSSRKLKFGSGTISVFAMMGKIYDSSSGGEVGGGDELCGGEVGKRRWVGGR